MVEVVAEEREVHSAMLHSSDAELKTSTFG